MKLQHKFYNLLKRSVHQLRKKNVTGLVIMNVPEEQFE